FTSAHALSSSAMVWCWSRVREIVPGPMGFVRAVASSYIQFLCGLVLSERFIGTPIMLRASASLKKAHTVTLLACSGVPDADGALPAGGNVTPPASFFVLSPLHEVRSKAPKANATLTNRRTSPPTSLLISNSTKSGMTTRLISISHPPSACHPADEQ